MGRLTEGQQGWLQELRALVGAGPAGAEVRLDTDSNGQPTEEGPRRSSAAGQALFDAPVNSAKNANVTLVPDDKLKLPPVDNLELPKVENNLIEIHDSKTGLVEKMLYSELRDSAYYVDNGILSLTAQPTVTTLTVKWMRLTYSGGRKLGIPMERVKFGSGPRDVVRAAEGLHRPARCRRRDPLRQEQHAERRHLRPVGPRRAVAPLSAACRDRGAGRDLCRCRSGPCLGLARRSWRGSRRTPGRCKADSAVAAVRKFPAPEARAQHHRSGSQGRHRSPSRAQSRPARAASDRTRRRAPIRRRPLRRDARSMAIRSDSTPAVKRPGGGDTVDTSSPKGGSQRTGHVPGEVLTPRPVEATARIPDTEQISIRTSKGPSKMTVGEYRKRWQAARHWLREEHSKTNARKNVPESAELIKQAQEKFGLDEGWLSVGNPYIYGKL